MKLLNRIFGNKEKSLRRRLIFPVIVSLVAVLILNSIMFGRINETIDSLDNVYETNLQLNSLRGALASLQEDFSEYVNTQSDESLENYKKSYSEYEFNILDIDEKINDAPVRVLERNIKMLSLSYLETVAAAVDEKQKGDMNYRIHYEESREIYEYLLYATGNLDGMRFEVNSKNYDLLYQSLKLLERFILLLLIAVVLLLPAILYRVMTSIILPLSDLSAKAVEVQNGNLDTELPVPEYTDEVGNLTIAFNQMLESIRKYIEEIKESNQREMRIMEKELMTENLLKDAQIKYYQAQINPHFLFNTLNAGQQLAMMEDAERTYLFLQSTAAFFRGQLKGNGKESTIREELELVDHYIYIMNVRYSGEIFVIKEINEKLLNIRFPGMILQPVIENSLRYAFPDPEQKKEIRIYIAKDGDCCKIQLQDFGNGIEKEILESLKNGSMGQSDGENGNGVGLKNVKERLKLFYDRQDVFDIESRGRGTGTTVTIRVPIES